jgi:hypothetical protein
MRLFDLVASCALVVISAGAALGQESPPQDPPSHAGHDMSEAPVPSSWMLMYDGALFSTFNRQGGPRGGREFIATNWLMGMASRPVGPGQLLLTGMISLDPFTVGGEGYRELFQVGESYRGRPIVDRQHPHDFLMQAAAAWRVPLGARTGLTIAGGPVGEPSLGPVAFMHRRSAAENSVAPLAHHSLDSTHIAMSVIAASIDHGPWTFESSVFHGQEPDDDRWDLVEGGQLDSWAARVWFEPGRNWALQASHGSLDEPEALHPGDVRRTTASAAWQADDANGFDAVTLAYGRNDEAGAARHAFLAEATSRSGSMSLYGRLELVQVDTNLLIHRDIGGHEQAAARSTVVALTLGAAREMARWRGFEIAAGGQVTLSGVPATLEPSYGNLPRSFGIFLRVRPPESGMGRMWNMRMTRPLRH